MGRGAPPPLLGGKTGTPSNTKSPELRPTPKWHLDVSNRLANGHNRNGQKIGERGSAPPFFWGGGTEAYLHAKYHLHSSNHLAAINMGRKLGGGSAPFWREERGPHLTQSRLGRGLAPYQVTFFGMEVGLSLIHI